MDNVGATITRNFDGLGLSLVGAGRPSGINDCVVYGCRSRILTLKIPLETSSAATASRGRRLLGLQRKRLTFAAARGAVMG